MGDKRGTCKLLVDRPEGEGLFRGPYGIGGRKILKWISKKWVGQAWIGLIRLRMEKGGRCL
jgi:hypothetical protein